MIGRSGRHECQVLPGILPEAEESCYKWMECQKNSGHSDFLSAPDFINNYLPRVKNGGQRKILRSFIDLTVRLRVGYTSQARPDGFEFSDTKGEYLPRVGTGFIKHVSGPEDNKPCKCHGKKLWKLLVLTAHHVVYDSDEALMTVVDVFYDDKESHTDGRMKSVRREEVVESYPDKDVCHMMCVTCDEDLGERIESAWKSYFYNGVVVLKNDLEDLGLLQSSSKYYDPALIVSHPHGQPKQVTVGELRYTGKAGNKLRQYTTPTCPGCSGAPVFSLEWERTSFYWYKSVHSGSYGETCPERCDKLSPVQQLNYGHLEWL